MMPLNTSTAGPVMSRWPSSVQSMVSGPPLRSTVTGHVARCCDTAAAAAAHAPVPQASVSPTPRSHVR